MQPTKNTATHSNVLYIWVKSVTTDTSDQIITAIQTTNELLYLLLV